jgi:saccharopine dehydrogenase (NAD+, L-lysine-forming)
VSHTTIGILGGYGNTGREVARLLLEHTDVHLLLAGRDAQKASQAAEMWNARVAGQRVRALRADAAEADSLRHAFEGIDLVVVASSSSVYVRTVAEAALAAGIDYMDPQYSNAKLGVLRSMAARIEAAGLCFITDAGFHPGLPAALVRFAGQRLGQITSATVSSVIQEDWARLEFSPSTIEELVMEFRDYRALHFKEGRWRSMGWLEMMRPIWMTFSHGFGRRYTVPMFLEEMCPLPDLIPGLVETGFYVGGFNPVADYLILPLVMGLVSVAPRRGLRLAGRMLAWGLQRFSKPPFGTLLRLEARGGIDGQGRVLTVEVYHHDGYVLTAAPMVACLLQVLDGSRRPPGLHLQALLVEPARLLADLQRMGIDVVIQEGGEAPDGG